MSSTLIAKWIERSLEWNCKRSLTMCLLEISCFSWVLWMFLIFEDLWWEFLGALELESDEALMDQSLWKFLEALKLIIVELWDFEEWFRWMFFIFEGFLIFLEALELDFCRVPRLLNVFLSSSTILRRVSIYKSLEEIWRHVIGSH